MATVNMYRKFREVWRYVLRYASRQAGRHTNTLIALFYIPTRGGEVITVSCTVVHYCQCSKTVTTGATVLG